MDIYGNLRNHGIPWVVVCCSRESPHWELLTVVMALLRTCAVDQDGSETEESNAAHLRPQPWLSRHGQNQWLRDLPACEEANLPPKLDGYHLRLYPMERITTQQK